MSADPRLVSTTRTTWYRGASTVTVSFSYLSLTASRAPEARAPETPARAPETRRVRAPKPRRGHADHLRTDAPRDTPPHADTAHAPHTHARSGLWSLIIITSLFVRTNEAIIARYGIYLQLRLAAKNIDYLARQTSAGGQLGGTYPVPAIGFYRSFALPCVFRNWSASTCEAKSNFWDEFVRLETL